MKPTPFFPWKWAAVAAAVALGVPGAAPPARADAGGVGTVTVAAATAAVTAVATYLVKDYFDARKENEKLDRDTDALAREIERVTRATDELDRENVALAGKIKGANDAAAFYTRLIYQDEDFFKPPAPTPRLLSYERGLELLYIQNPALVAKFHAAIASPPGEYERYIVTRAFGVGVAGADFGEIKRRMAAGVEGGVVKVAGETEPRYVSGAENLMAIVDYVKGAAGDEYPVVLARLWGCGDEEMDAFFAVFPQ